MKSKTSVRKTVLDAAAAAVLGDRQLNYGSPEDNFGRIAKLWNTHLENAGIIEASDGARLMSRADVAVFLVLLKAARLANTPDHLDSWTDIAGYAACGAEVSQKG